MNGARWLVVFGFVVALAAGAVLGVAQERARRAPAEGSWLAMQLNLTPEQQEQIRQVWSEVQSLSGREYRDRRAALAKERETQVRALLTDEQRSRFEEILAEYQRKVDALAAERERAVQAAIEKTKMLLDERQRAKYEQLLKEREMGGPPPGERGARKTGEGAR